MTKTKKLLLMTALCFTTFTFMSDMILVPVADNLYAEFGNVKEGILNFILSGAAIVAGFSALLFGGILKKGNKKKLLILSYLIFAIPAICTDFIHNAVFMAVMRAIAGFGFGGVNVIAMDIISDVFTDEEERGNMIGYYNAAQGATAAILSILAGIVAVSGWRNVFKLFWLSVPILLMILFWVPNDAPGAAEEEHGAEAASLKNFAWKKVIPMNIAFFVYNITYCIVYYQVALIMAEKGLGNSVVYGLLSSVGTISGVVVAVAFGAIYKRLRRFTSFVGFALMAGSFLWLYFCRSVWESVVICALLGGLYALGLSFYGLKSTLIVPPAQVSVSIGIATFVSGLGGALSTFATTALQGAVGVDTITATLPVVVGTLAVGAALAIVLALRNKENKIKGQEE